MPESKEINLNQMDESEFDIDLAIYKAALHDDWDSVKHIFERHPEKLDAGITKFSETPLHIAVGTNLSHHFVEKLVDRIVSVDVRKLRTGTNWGTAPLHYASQVGNIQVIQNGLFKRGDNIMRSMTNIRPHLLTGCLSWAYYCLSSRFWVVLRYLVPCVKEIHDMKVMHIQAQQLVQEICLNVMKTANHSIAWNILGRAMCTAAEHGVHELIEECLKTYPGAVWHAVEGLYLFVIAIKYRQEKVYNLIYQMSGHKEFVATDKLSGEETTLHIAARLAPVHRLKSITGAALQMQRELQWFKEVENFVQPSYKEALNSEEKTPRMLFTDEHCDLHKEGQTWMIGTASSSLFVAALIVTVAFAAAFTVPGGSNNDGLPLFSGDGVFILFMVSDAIALFSSSTSVLMLLAILTSRYAEEDILYALPNRMTIGLMSLFLSLATTMAAFSATLVLVLCHQISWIVAPVVLLASIPITLSAFLQFPLLKELVIATYGPSIFCKQNNVLLH